MTRPTPLLDFFKRGEVEPDAKLQAAQGAPAPSAQEQLVILILLLEEADPEIRATASVTISRIQAAALTAYLARPDVPLGTREFFGDRGVFPDEIQPIEVDDPLIDTTPEEFGEPAGLGMPEEPESPRERIAWQIAKMGFSDRLKAAVKGTREMRSSSSATPTR